MSNQEAAATRCGNCGYVEPLTDNLRELGFQWLDPVTTKTACRSCGAYVIMRAWAVENGVPVGGEMLVVKTTLFKGAKAYERHTESD